MYNVYKYQEDVRTQESMRQQEENYTKWMIRHEEAKKSASDKLKQKVDQFLLEESMNPSIVEDDHYKTWRYNKQFRDVENSQKFCGFKAFQFKPNYEIGKHFSERERRQMKYNADKSQQLVKSRRIPEELKSRSLRSQGPLNPKHTFRDQLPDRESLQPRMRYTNITDKQRQLEASTTYDQKFSNLYKTFHLTKSKIGQPRISPRKSESKNQASQLMDSAYSDVAKNEHYYYDALNQEQKSIMESKYFAQGEPRSTEKRKAYFKTAKTMALNGNKKAQEIMIQTQYDRRKDLSNLQRNMDNESFIKRPIL